MLALCRWMHRRRLVGTVLYTYFAVGADLRAATALGGSKNVYTYMVSLPGSAALIAIAIATAVAVS